MALAHRELPVFGVQFHPEAILTEGGYELLGNFLRAAGHEPARPLPSLNLERPPATREFVPPPTPVTF